MTKTSYWLSKQWLLSLIACAMLTSACTTSPVTTNLRKAAPVHSKQNVKYPGHYKIGRAYTINGKTYIPKVNINYDQTGMASWYGSRHGFHGRKTANGDRYNKYSLSAAHPSLPLPSLVKVTNLSNKKSLILMVNDRGPFVKKRILDVSERAAEILGFKHCGVAQVRVQYLHHETKNFLKKLALNSRHGATAKPRLENKSHTVNCHVKLINRKHRLAVN